MTKKPLDLPYYSLEQQFGAYDFYRTEWDATGPVTQDKSLLYRFTGAYPNNDTFRDFETLERILVHPILTWRPSPATELSLDLEYLRDEGRFILIGIPAIGDRPAPIPIGRTFQDPNDPDDDFIENIRLGFQLTHRFNETWTLQNRFLATFRDNQDLNLFSFGLRPDDRTLDRGVLFQGITRDACATNFRPPDRADFEMRPIQTVFRTAMAENRIFASRNVSFQNPALSTLCANAYSSDTCKGLDL